MLGRPTKGGNKNNIALCLVNEQPRGPQKPTYADMFKSAIIRHTGDAPRVRTEKCLSPIPDTSSVASSSEGEMSSGDCSDDDIQPESKRKALDSSNFINNKKRSRLRSNDNQYITSETYFSDMQYNRKRNQRKICNCQGNKKRIKVHVRQHYTRNFCSWGYNSVSRDMVLSQTKKCENSNRIAYELDKKSYPLFCNTMGWKNPPKFHSCQPKWSDTETVSEARTKSCRSTY